MLRIHRGLPGSGKSTGAEQVAGYVHVEADMYFMQNGEYVYDSSKLSAAHAWCFDRVSELLLNDEDVIVSNTFTTAKELRPYIKFAEENGISVMVYTFTKNYGSTHDVPDATMEKMERRFVSQGALMQLFPDASFYLYNYLPGQ